MSSPCAYAVNGAILRCDLGSATSNIKATHHNRVRITKKNQCNKKDKIINQNIFDFGTCSKGGRCKNKITLKEWQKTAKPYIAGSHALLVQSVIECEHTGKITFLNSGQMPLADYDPNDPDSLDQLLDLIRKVEQANPDWSKSEVLGALRRLGGVDYSGMRQLLGTENAANEILPRGKLTQEDINELRRLLVHDVIDGKEVGIIKDHQGTWVAMSHVFTGLEAGLNRNTSAASGGKKGELGMSFLGTRMDNIHAATITGDLGQSLSFDPKESIGGYVYIGEGTEADFAELNGDLDGLIIGEHLAYPNSGDAIEAEWYSNRPFSDFIDDYYNNHSAGRYSITNNFLLHGNRKAFFEEQVRKFSRNYNMTIESKGLSRYFAGVDKSKLKSVMKEFTKWCADMEAMIAKMEVTDGTC